MGYKVHVVYYMMIISVNTVIICQRNDVYHHCYQEGGRCGTKNITCYNDTVIDIVWSRVGYSEYWAWDPYRTNCSVTDELCEKEIDEPSRNCSGLAVCYLNTCSDSTHQEVDCHGLNQANYMTINYTCSEEDVTRSTSVTLPEDPTASTPGDTERTIIIIVLSVIGGAVVLAGVVGVVIMALRCKHNEANSPETEKQGNEASRECSDSVDTGSIRYTSVNHVKPHTTTPSINRYPDTVLVDNETYVTTDPGRNIQVTHNTEDQRTKPSASRKNTLSYEGRYFNYDAARGATNPESFDVSSYEYINLDHVSNGVSRNGEVWPSYHLVRSRDMMKPLALNGASRLITSPPSGQVSTRYATPWHAAEKYIKDDDKPLEIEATSLEHQINDLRARNWRLPRL